MRPSDITDGIYLEDEAATLVLVGFNEAVGYYRRNPLIDPNSDDDMREASMRPSDITDGIVDLSALLAVLSHLCFNEAVGYYRRNRTAPKSKLYSRLPAEMREVRCGPA